MITLAWFFSLNLSPICIKKDLQLARDYYQALDSVYDVQYAIPLSPTNTHIDTEYHMSSFRHLSISNLAFFFFFMHTDLSWLFAKASWMCAWSS